MCRRHYVPPAQLALRFGGESQKDNRPEKKPKGFVRKGRKRPTPIQARRDGFSGKDCAAGAHLEL